MIVLLIEKGSTLVTATSATTHPTLILHLLFKVFKRSKLMFLIGIILDDIRKTIFSNAGLTSLSLESGISDSQMLLNYNLHYPSFVAIIVWTDRDCSSATSGEQ